MLDAKGYLSNSGVKGAKGLHLRHLSHSHPFLQLNSTHRAHRT